MPNCHIDIPLHLKRKGCPYICTPGTTKTFLSFLLFIVQHVIIRLLWARSVLLVRRFMPKFGNNMFHHWFGTIVTSVMCQAKPRLRVDLDFYNTADYDLANLLKHKKWKNIMCGSLFQNAKKLWNSYLWPDIWWEACDIFAVVPLVVSSRFSF